MRTYLLGRSFLAVTDHSSLQWMLGSTNSKIGRWSALLCQYQFKIFWRAGKCNVLADLLSRHPFGRADDSDETKELLSVLHVADGVDANGEVFALEVGDDCGPDFGGAFDEVVPGEHAICFFAEDICAVDAEARS